MTSHPNPQRMYPTMEDTGLPVAGASVVDLFCGAGGLSYGLQQEGFLIAAGVDLDADCRYPYETNIQAPFLCRDIAALDGPTVAALFPLGTLKILVGCAPCQPFSPYNRKRNSSQWRLLSHFLALIQNIRPEIVSMENVPRLCTFKQGRLFRYFVTALTQAGYAVVWNRLFGPDYGLPQTRTRLVLIASRLGSTALPLSTHAPDRYRTVADAIGTLPWLRAGAVDPQDRLHRARNLSPLNMQRMQASRPGGTWRDWPDRLVVPCHQRHAGRTFHAVYGRLEWHKPAPTLTTQFSQFGSGRFGHPVQDRALSLREGTLLQGFPPRYAFVPPDRPVRFTALGRLIGNAVPVTLSLALARALKFHLQEHA